MTKNLKRMAIMIAMIMTMGIALMSCGDDGLKDIKARNFSFNIGYDF